MKRPTAIALIFVATSLALAPLVTPTVLAQEACTPDSKFCALAPIPGLTDVSPTSAVNADTLAAFFNNLYRYLIGLAAALAVIEIVWGGLEISTKDSVSKQSDGKNRITQAIFGLILVLMPVLVFSIINPSILDLKIAMPALDTTYIPGQAGSGAVPIGGLCSSSAQCSTGFCNPETPPPTQNTIGRCTNTPDDSGNQCEPGSNPPSGKSCPEYNVCAITAASENKYVCTLDCFVVDPDFVDCTGAKLAAWCPTAAPDYDVCKMSANGTIAVCTNMNPQAQSAECEIVKKGPQDVSALP